MICLIACISKDGGLGKNGELLYHDVEDMERFKNLTYKHTVIMGRKTFESLPHGALKNRRNIVLTRNENFSAENVEVARTIRQILLMTKDDGLTFVIGGGEVYEQFLLYADIIYLSVMDSRAPEGTDTWFPKFSIPYWQVETLEHCDNKDFVTFIRIK